jgi:hypothetical protein
VSRPRPITVIGPSFKQQRYQNEAVRQRYHVVSVVPIMRCDVDFSECLCETKDLVFDMTLKCQKSERNPFLVVFAFASLGIEGAGIHSSDKGNLQ